MSDHVGVNCVGWRYDPILLNQKYTKERHIEEFTQMAAALSGYTKTCVISFIDIYKKVERNFPTAQPVAKEDRLYLGKTMIEIAGRYGMTVRPCAEGDELAPYGADCSGCMRQSRRAGLIVNCGWSCGEFTPSDTDKPPQSHGLHPRSGCYTAQIRCIFSPVPQWLH